MIFNFKNYLIIFIIFTLIFYFLKFIPIQAQTKPINSSCQFERNLFPSLKGDDVKCLQTYLKQSGYFNGPITGYYGNLTKEAVRKWQKANNIFPAHGYFSLISRKFYLSLFSKQELADQSKQQKQQGLILPEVKDDEIIIDNNNGFNQIDLYFKHIFVDNTPKIDYNKVQQLFETEPFSLEFLIDKALNDKNFNEQMIKQKAELFENFYQQRLAILKKVPINKNLNNLHKIFIINDTLSQELAIKFKNYLDGVITKEEFNNYYQEYKNKINFLRNSLKLTSLKYFDNKINFLSLLMNFLIKPVFAQLSLGFQPFGGRIISIVPCTCNAGRLIYVGPPRPIILFVPFGFEASPLLYLWKNINTPGVWLLGLAHRIPVPCFTGSPPTCTPVGSGLLIYMTGTSLTP